MTDRHNQNPVIIQIIRWFARWSGTVIAFFAIVSLFLRPLYLFRTEVSIIIERLAFFLMIAGFLAGWKWELAAGIMILFGYIVFAIMNQILFLNWMLTLFPLIGICYLAMGIFDYRKKRRHPYHL